MKHIEHFPGSVKINGSGFNFFTKTDPYCMEKLDVHIMRVLSDKLISFLPGLLIMTVVILCMREKTKQEHRYKEIVHEREKLNKSIAIRRIRNFPRTISFGITLKFL